MTSVFTSRRIRWAIPALVAAAVAAAAVTTTSGAGAAEQPKLPPRTAAQLLAAVEQAHPVSLFGTIVETARLGLPNLPSSNDSSGGDNLSFQSLLTGSHTLRIWYDGPTKQRVALMAPLSERDVVHNGTNLWTYTSTTNEVTHSTVRRDAPGASSEMLGLTPQQAATQALAAVGPTTQVTVDKTARVAGQAAYQVDLTPRDSRSLIGSVRIAIDSVTSVPLRVQIFAAGAATPAIDVGFTDISYTAPSPSVFNFVTPPGATLSQESNGAVSPDHHSTPDGSDAPSSPGFQRRPAVTSGAPSVADGPTTFGNGWTAVREFSFDQFGRSSGYLMYRLSSEVPGGRLITSSLLSVLITEDGHIFVGPVSGKAIQQVAATGHGL